MAVMLVTSCVIPIGVLLIYINVIKSILNSGFSGYISINDRTGRKQMPELEKSDNDYFA